MERAMGAREPRPGLRRVEESRHEKKKENRLMSLIRLENRWNPFREMQELQNRLNTLFGVAAPPATPRNESQEALTVSNWSPLVDIVEDEKEYLIKAEVPEVQKTDLSVKVQDGVLTVSGERKFEKEDKNRRYHRVERVYGNFSRSFTLPDDADDSKVNAEFKDGVLLVHVAKSEKARPKQIDVKIN
jgi:HSP20 family protein